MNEEHTTRITRRDALLACATATVGAALTNPGSSEAGESAPSAATAARALGEYSGERLSRVAFP
jgi:hypothetical protein